MKKRKIACLALAAPMLALAACTSATPALALSSNWFLNTGDARMSDAGETLVYSVAFEAEEGNDFLTYGEGTYTSVLTAEPTELADGATELCYHLHTELTIPVTYTVGGEEATFNDSVLSDVWFRDVTYSLRPVRSEKQVVTHSPFSGETPSSLEGAYREYAYTYTAEYNTGCTSADVKVAYTKPEETEQTRTVSLDGGGTYLDNEQILFALRGIDMSSSVTFRSINPAKYAQEDLSMTEAPASSTEKLTFSMNGESAERELTVYTFSLGYSGNNPGMAQQLTYAGLVSATANTYRCALLRMEVPVLFSLGTLTYTLTEATFGA